MRLMLIGFGLLVVSGFGTLGCIAADPVTTGVLPPPPTQPSGTLLPNASPNSGFSGTGAPLPTTGGGLTPGTAGAGALPPTAPVLGNGGAGAPSTTLDPNRPPDGVQRPAGPVEWTTFNYDNDNSRNNRTEKKITVDNVAMLTEKWGRDLKSGVSSTPLVVGGKVYVGDHSGSMYSLNAETGEQVWATPRLFQPRTGTNLVVGDKVLGAGGQFLHARNIATGAAAWMVQLNNHPQTMIDSSPVLAGDTIVIGVANYELINSTTNYTARGGVIGVGLDGTKKWEWWTTKGDATEGNGVSVWSSAAYDPGRKLIFIGTGEGYEAPVPPTSDALVAIKSDTGAVLWSNQFHKDDIYTQPGGCMGGRMGPNCDFDIGASPNLFRAQGKDVVGVGSKGGLFRVLERDSGAMVWEHMLGSGTWWGGVMAVSATDDTTIYVANNNYQNGESLIALDMETGTEKWKVPTMSAVWGALTIANGVLFTCDKAGMMTAYDTKDGRKIKDWDLGHDAASGVSVSDGVVYASSGFTGQGNVARPGARVTAFTLP